MSVTRVVKYALKTKRGKKLLSEAQKLIHKKKSKTIQQLSVKGVHKDVPLRVSSDKQVKTFKQKPKHPHGGSERYPQISSIHPGASEVPINQKTLGATIRRMPYIGSRESWNAEMTRMFGGIHMSQDPKKIKKSIKVLTKKKKVVKALRGALIKKGTKLAFKLATKKYPQLFKKQKYPNIKLKAKKIKTPELESLGVTKTTALNLRKLSVAEVTKERIRHLGKIVLKHNRKAMPLVWSKASKWRHIEKFQKYNKPQTATKLKVLGKQHSDLTKYQETIKAKTATKHSEGGEVVFGKNVDRSLL